MAKFDFRLDTVRQVREREEQEAQRELMQAELERKEIQAQITELKKMAVEVESGLKQKQVEGVQVAELADHMAYLYQLQGDTALREDELLRAINVVGQKRQLLAEASKKKKMIENLKDKQYLRWKRDTEKREAETLDELATLRYQHRKGE